jgi:hypothetical protein
MVKFSYQGQLMHQPHSMQDFFTKNLVVGEISVPYAGRPVVHEPV